MYGRCSLSYMALCLHLCILNSKAQKKKQKKNMARFLKEMGQGKKPAFDNDKMSFEEYLNQYYNLDFEDVVCSLSLTLSLVRIIRLRICTQFGRRV